METEGYLEMTNYNDVLYCTTIYQTGNGVMFYHQHCEPQRLYVKWQGNEIDANLPPSQSYRIYASQNTVFFAANKKIYRVEFSPPNALRVMFLRDIVKGEVVEDRGKGLVVRQLHTMTLFYRMFDDSGRDAITANFDYERENLLVQDIHRKKVVFAACRQDLEDAVVTMNDAKVVVIEIPGVGHPSFFSQESSSFIYISNGEYLFILDSDTMEFLPCLQFNNDFANNSIIGIHNGISYLKSNSRGDCYFYTAQLPNGYALGKEEEWTKERERSIKKHSEIENELRTALEKLAMVNMQNQELFVQNEEMKNRLSTMGTMLIECKIWALTSAKKPLKFDQNENLTKPFVSIQLERGTIIYFDNAKPFELFTMRDGLHDNADLKLLDGEFDCSFRGTISDIAYFNTIRGKIVKFFSTKVEQGKIQIQQINEMRNSEISLLKNQPFYFIERSKEWSVYKYGEDYTQIDGEKFDISEIDLLSKYERHYHRGVMYLFRETSIAKVEKVNEKVVKIEGPLLDETSFYTPSHSDCIYILNQEENVLLILDTTDLTVSQLCYEPPAGSNNHSIVGIHDGILTMAFDGVWGRNLSTAKLH